MSLSKPKLAVWLHGNRVSALSSVAMRWWEQCADWLRIPLSFGDVMTAPLAIVDLYAYQRGITRSALDTERRYRLKVHHALRNAHDAGTLAGMVRIFERLELPAYGLTDRLAGYDWDVVAVDMDVRELDSQRPYLMDIWGLYGRTCRRFAMRGVTVTAATLRAAAVGRLAQVLQTAGAIAVPTYQSQSYLSSFSTAQGVTLLQTSGGLI